MYKRGDYSDRGAFSDYSCRGSFHSNASFRFHFYCFVDLVVFFTSSQTSLHWSFRLVTGYFHVQSGWCIASCFCIAYRNVLRLYFGAILIALFSLGTFAFYQSGIRMKSISIKIKISHPNCIFSSNPNFSLLQVLVFRLWPLKYLSRSILLGRLS